MRKLLPCFLLVSVAALSVILKADDEVIESIVARVNNQIITHSEYLHSKEELKKEAQQQEPVNADKFVADHDKDVLRDLIDQQLLLQKGKDLGITADTEVIKKLDEMRKDMKLDSMEELEKAAQSQGISFEDFKQNMRNQIITQQVIGKEVGSRLVIDKGDEQKFYEEHKADMEQPETIRLSEILVSTEAKPNDSADEAQRVKAAQAKADDLLAQIRKGAKFEDIAKKNSDGPTAAQGGDLGEFKRGTLAKQIEDKTFAMKVGDVSDVIQTRQGSSSLRSSSTTMPEFHLQRSRAANPGRALHEEIAARATRISHQTARGRIYRRLPRLRRLWRQPQPDQACRNRGQRSQRQGTQKEEKIGPVLG